MQTYSTILNAIAEALMASTAIKTFLTSKGYSALSVFVGEDAANPAGISNAPYIVLMPGTGGSDVNDAQLDIDLNLECDFGISEKGTTTSASGVVSLTGIANLDAFASLIFAAIQGVYGNVTKAEYVNDSTYLPLIQGGFSITIKVETYASATP